MKRNLLQRVGLACLFFGAATLAAQEVPVTVQVTSVRVCWSSTPGQLYQLQYRTAPTMVWTDLGATITATSSQVCVDDPTGTRIYRVLMVAPPPPPVVPNTPPTMVFIPPGSFTMGSPVTEVARGVNEGPQTQVTLTRGFWMDQFEITQAQYLAIVGVNPSYSTNNLNRPVERVTWYDATNYCRLLTVRESAAGRLPAGYIYRLPTEAEWEYACRAGTTTAFHYGNEMRSGMANFDGRWEYPPCAGDTNGCFNPTGIYLGGTTTVGNYQPNAFGLYDMHGNVWEWTQDWYFRDLPGGSVTNPQGPAPRTEKVLKGGRYYYYSSNLRSAFRTGHLPAGNRNDLGFRTVLVQSP
ncbi:MAG: formylglycine-generating enzyme family protein [Pyrinomonadaceae bacterium]|nr:formylglycine-generating enzyme family protein [Phycisphaerales bacterium]